MNMVRLAEPLLEEHGPVTSFAQLEELTDSLISVFNNWGKYAKKGLSSCENLALSNTVELSRVEEAPLMLDIPDHCYKRVKVGQGEGFELTEREIRLLTEVEAAAVDTVDTVDTVDMVDTVDTADKVEEVLDTFGEYLKGFFKVKNYSLKGFFNVLNKSKITLKLPANANPALIKQCFTLVHPQTLSTTPPCSPSPRLWGEGAMGRPICHSGDYFFPTSTQLDM